MLSVLPVAKPGTCSPRASSVTEFRFCLSDGRRCFLVVLVHMFSENEAGPLFGRYRSPEVPSLPRGVFSLVREDKPEGVRARTHGEVEQPGSRRDEPARQHNSTADPAPRRGRRHALVVPSSERRAARPGRTVRSTALRKVSKEARSSQCTAQVAGCAEPRPGDSPCFYHRRTRGQTVAPAPPSPPRASMAHACIRERAECTSRSRAMQHWVPRAGVTQEVATPPCHVCRQRLM